MSETTKRPYAQVMRVAEILVDSLRPHCHRIEIAGSLRRQEEMVFDLWGMDFVLPKDRL